MSTNGSRGVAQMRMRDAALGVTVTYDGPGRPIETLHVAFAVSRSR
jgi:hypothetical protein